MYKNLKKLKILHTSPIEAAKFVNSNYNELSNSKTVGIIAKPTSLLPKTLKH